MFGRNLLRKAALPALAALAATLAACSFINSFDGDSGGNVVSAMSFDKNTVSLPIGGMEIINLAVSATQGQAAQQVVWEYDQTKLKAVYDNYSIVLTGLAAGSATVRARCGGQAASCVVNVSETEYQNSAANPYVYIADDSNGVVFLEPNETKRVSAALFGVANADINGFSFSIDKPSVADVQKEGNYCWLTGKSEGMAQVTARHKNASYGYTFLVCCSPSSTSLPYITTRDNIVSMNLSDKSPKKISVDLAHATYTTYKDDFQFSVVGESGQALAEPPLQITCLNESATLTPLKSGNCYVKVSHKDALYDLLILVRISESVDGAYVKLSESTVVVNGSEAKTLEASVFNDAGAVPVEQSSFSWTFSEGASDYADLNVFGGSESGKGGSLWISGKKQGSFKVTASHPASDFSASALVVVRGGSQDALSSQVYISTNKNYIETYAGAPSVDIEIIGSNLSSGEENLFEWKIESLAADGSKDPVVVYSQGTGTAVAISASRSMAMSSVTTGWAEITPLKEGRATITISHPKAAFSTKILVNVRADAPAAKKRISLSSSSGFVLAMKGKPQSVKASAGSPEESAKIAWASSSANFTVAGSGEEAMVTYTGSGYEAATLTASHPEAEYPMAFSLAGYETEEDLSACKLIYSNFTAKAIMVGDKESVPIYGVMLSDGETPKYSVKSGLNDVISFKDNGMSFEVEGLSAGTAEIQAKLESTGQTVSIYIQVKDPGVVEEDKPCYLTTYQNAVTVGFGQSEDVSVSFVNIAPSAWGSASWTSSDESLFTVAANGESATVTGNGSGKEGIGTLRVKHPLSSNELEIQVKVGGEEIYPVYDVPYISLSEEAVYLEKGGPAKSVYAVLARTATSETKTSGFTFKSSDESVFSLSWNSQSQWCEITPKKAGKGILTVSHPDAAYSKEIGVTVTTPGVTPGGYLSTTMNVVYVEQGEFAVADAEVVGAASGAPSDWTWNSADFAVADVVSNNGPTAMVSGVSPGTTKLTVRHSSCDAALEMIVICVAKSETQAKPFIQTSSNIVALKIGMQKTVTASLAGVPESESKNLQWTVMNPAVAMIQSGSGTCSIRGLTAGQTYVKVSARSLTGVYEKTVFVRVEDGVVDACWIKPSVSTVNLNPERGGTFAVTAELVGGEATDAKDFVWWIDDGSLVTLKSVTDTATLSPNGSSGFAYLHVKHPKVLEPLDILVICSKYEKFQFSKASQTVVTKQFQYVRMEVPVSDVECSVKYESSNPDVCVATGSKNVCLIAGVRKGSAQVKASLLTSSGSVVATSECAVIVEAAVDVVNSINSGSSILDLTVGDSRTLSASLSGAEIQPGDENAILWEVDDTSVCSLITTEAGRAKGKDVYLKAVSAGDAIVTASHPKCRYPQTFYVKVKEKTEATLSLSSAFIEIFMGQGSERVEATVEGGASSDEITWTAPNVNGVKVISVTKMPGKACTIVGNNPGTTILRGQLPNGNYAECVVTVYKTAELTFQTRTAHVVPGYDEVVKYTVTPENAQVIFIADMDGVVYGQNVEPFTFSNNEASKELTIHGIDVGSGTIYGRFASTEGTASSSLSVKSEYLYEVQFDAGGVVQTEPSKGTVARIPFHVWPTNLEVKATSLCPDMTIKSYSVDTKTGKGEVLVETKKEFIGEKIQLSATNPRDLANTPKFAEQAVNSYYKSLHLRPVFNYATGNFSKYDANKSELVLGDGESVSFYIEVQEENADISDVEVYWHDGPDDDSRCLQNADPSTPQPGIRLPGSASKKNGAWQVQQTGTGEDGQILYELAHNKDYVERGTLFKGVYEPARIDNLYLSFGHRSAGSYSRLTCNNSRNLGSTCELVATIYDTYGSGTPPSHYDWKSIEGHEHGGTTTYYYKHTDACYTTYYEYYQTPVDAVVTWKGGTSTFMAASVYWSEDSGYDNNIITSDFHSALYYNDDGSMSWWNNRGYGTRSTHNLNDNMDYVAILGTAAYDNFCGWAKTHLNKLSDEYCVYNVDDVRKITKRLNRSGSDCSWSFWSGSDNWYYSVDYTIIPIPDYRCGTFSRDTRVQNEYKGGYLTVNYKRMGTNLQTAVIPVTVQKRRCPMDTDPKKWRMADRGDGISYAVCSEETAPANLQIQYGGAKLNGQAAGNAGERFYADVDSNVNLASCVLQADSCVNCSASASGGQIMVTPKARGSGSFRVKAVDMKTGVSLCSDEATFVAGGTPSVSFKNGGQSSATELSTEKDAEGKEFLAAEIQLEENFNVYDSIYCVCEAVREGDPDFAVSAVQASVDGGKLRLSIVPKEGVPVAAGDIVFVKIYLYNEKDWHDGARAKILNQLKAVVSEVRPLP